VLVRKIIQEKKVPAAARAGIIAPVDVILPPGPTGMDPGQTAFFQALNIATKISRGQIELSRDVHLIRKGDKVNASAVVLLNKLGVKPFYFGLKVTTVYENGDVYPADVIDITDDQLVQTFLNGVGKIAALSASIQYANSSTVSFSMRRGFKKLIELSVATDYTFAESKLIKEMIANPDKFKKEEKKDEPKKDDDKKDDNKDDDNKNKDSDSDSDAGGVGNIFGNDSDSSSDDDDDDGDDDEE